MMCRLVVLIMAGMLLVAAPSLAVQVKMVTSSGTIVLELDEKNAPLSVANFLAYTDEGFYNGTIFHRVIKGFMIQGGGFGTDLKRKQVNAPIKNEGKNGLRNLRGTIAMARTNIPDSATSQFFINHVDNYGLDYPKPDGYGYAVFGRVIDGMDVVDAIAETKIKRGAGPFASQPVETVEIISVERVK